MCGRFTITVSEEELMFHYFIDTPANGYHTPRYNVAPTQLVPVILNHEGAFKLDQFKWGLIPFWAKDEKIGYKMINARAETIADKSFKDSFKRRRCIIPTDGFYEWKTIGKDKQPYRIVMKDKQIFSMAGIWSSWTKPDGDTLYSCSIITTEPNELMTDIHDRMPVILDREDERRWLDDERDTEDLKAMLRPFPVANMRAYAVAKAVGSVKNQGVELIEETTI